MARRKADEERLGGIVYVALTAEARSQLGQLAREQGLTVSAAIRRLILQAATSSGSHSLISELNQECRDRLRPHHASRSAAHRRLKLDDLPEFLRVYEVAALLDVSSSTIYGMVAQNRLVAFRAGRLLRIPLEAVLILAGRK